MESEVPLDGYPLLFPVYGIVAAMQAGLPPLPESAWVQILECIDGPPLDGDSPTEDIVRCVVRFGMPDE